VNPDAWRLRLRLLLAIVSGGIAFCAFPPVDAGWASYAALVPLFLALRGARGRAGFLIGLVFGLAFIGPLIWWISLFGYLGWGVLLVAQALFFAVFGWFAAWASNAAIGRVVGVPVLYAALEVARTRWPLGGFSWGDLGYAQHDSLPLLSLARIGGVHLITLALAIIGALAAQVLCTGRVWRRAVALVVAGGIAAGPAWLPLEAAHRSGELDVALVQGNVPEGRFTGFADRVGRQGPEDLTIIENHIRETEPLAAQPPGLVVWPENSVDRDPFTNPSVGTRIEETVRTVHAPFIVGAILDAEDGRFTNTNLLYGADGGVTARYNKIHLVPFGEYVPWHRLRRYVKELEQIPSDGVPGTRPVIFTVGTAEVGTMICFESTYPSLARENVKEGADLLIVTTNNASFRRSPLARQHLAMSQLRAAEEGRTVLHAAIAGITAVIDPRGKIVTQTRLFRPALVRRTVELADGKTPYATFGDALELGIGGLGVFAGLAAAAGMVGRRRERQYARAEAELWGGEDRLRDTIAAREDVDREIAERIAERSAQTIEPDQLGDDGT
jgi:apolipoprotein N-acyltransferase